MHNHAARQLKLSASSPALATYLFCHLTYVGVAAPLSLLAANDIGTHTHSLYMLLYVVLVYWLIRLKALTGSKATTTKKAATFQVRRAILK